MKFYIRLLSNFKHKKLKQLNFNMLFKKHAVMVYLHRISYSEVPNKCLILLSLIRKKSAPPPSTPPSPSAVIRTTQPVLSNFWNFKSRFKKFEQRKTYLSIRNSIKSNGIDFLECFRFQCYL